MQHLKLASLIVFSILSLESFSQQAKIDVKKGEKYQVVSSTKVTSSMELMGQSMETKADNNSTTVYEVRDVEEAEIKLESKLTKLKVSSEIMGQTNDFDSDKKDNTGPGASEMTAMLNQPRTVKLDKKGTITKQDAPTEGGQAMEMLGMGKGDDSAIELFVPALIGVELKTGNVYPDSSEIEEEKLKTKSIGSYTITGIENGIASVSYTGTTTVNGQMEQMGQEMDMSSTSAVKTELKLDMLSGRIISKSGTSEGDMTVAAGGMTIPVKLKITSTTTTSLMK